MKTTKFTQKNSDHTGSGYRSGEELQLPAFGKEIVAGQTIYHKKEQLKMKKDFYLRLALLLGAINLLLIINSFGQLVTINNLAVTNSSQITIKGDLLNTSGTTINNTGIMEITGDVTNNSGSDLFGTSNGNVTLNGAAQNISGTDVTQFHDLSLAGTGSKTLQQNILVGGNNVLSDGVLSLGSTVLELNSKEVTITNQSASAITRSTGYIVSETGPAPGYGSIKWMVENNSGAYTFPFGNSVSGSYVPVTLEINQAGIGTDGYVKLATYPTITAASPNNRPLPTGITSLIDNYGYENAPNVLDRWWMLDVANYTTQPFSSISFAYRDSEWDGSAGSTNNISEPTLQAQSNNGSVWTPQTMGTVNTATNVVTVANINYYNPFWVLVGSTNPLPMTLLDFNVALNDKEDVDIDWATATEVNNDFFTLEKSRDGFTFESFATVDGAGNSTNVLYYKSLDKNPYEGITYYRLKQTDFDGQYSYSEIKSVRTKKYTAGSFHVYPNPATDHFYVKFDDEMIQQTLFIMDMNGKVIREISMEEITTAGSGLIKIDRLLLDAGIYFVATSEGKMQKLVMQ